MGPPAWKMRDKLAEAIELAAGVDPDAELVRIVGIGIHADGTVRPNAPTDWISRWEYAFENKHDGERPPTFVTVLYLYPDRPWVDENAGNVSGGEYFDPEVIDGLADSDQLVALFQDQPDVTPMSGQDSDVLTITMRRMLAPEAVLINWKGDCLRLDPVELEIL